MVADDLNPWAFQIENDSATNDGLFQAYVNNNNNLYFRARETGAYPDWYLQVSNGTTVVDVLTLNGSNATFGRTSRHYGNGAASLSWGDTSDVGALSFSGSNAIVRSTVNNADLIFQGNSSGLFAALTLDMSNGGQAIFNKGASFSDHVYLGDNDHLVLGGGDDLRIYHDGSDSYIKDAGTGDLYIQGEANVRITDGDGNKMFLGQNDGEVQLYYNGSERLHTSSVGVVLTSPAGSGQAVDLDFLSTNTSGFGSGYAIDSRIRSVTAGSSNAYHSQLEFYTNDTSNNLTERMRLNASGDWIVSNTVANIASGYSGQGGVGWVDADHHLEIATTNNRSSVEIGRNNANDGEVITLRKQSTVFGSIGTTSGRLYIGDGDVALRFADDLDFIAPWNASTNAARDGAIDLGNAGNRFREAYLSSNLKVGGSASFQFQKSGTHGYINQSDTGSLIFRMGSSFTERMRLNNDGALVLNNSGGDAQLYMGGTSGTSRMYLARSGTDTLLWNVSNGSMRFGTNDAEVMRLHSGTLHIGNYTTTNQKLRIQQTITNEWTAFLINYTGQPYGLAVDTSSGTAGSTLNFGAYTPSGTGFFLNNYGVASLGTQMYDSTNTGLQLMGRGIAIKNDRDGSSNNWSRIQNRATGSASDLYFGLGSGNIRFDHGGAIITNAVSGYHNYINAGQADSDFIVRTVGNTNMLHVDGGGNRVGVGTGSPRYELSVAGNNATAMGIAVDNANGSGTLDIAVLGSSYNSHQAGAGEIWFYSPDNINIGGATGNTNDIKFLANNSVNMIVKGSGSVGIGNTVPSSFVESSRFVVGSGTNGTNEMMFLYSGTDAFGAIGFADGTSGTERYRGIIGYHHSTDALFFSTSGGGEADRDLTISSSGNVGIGRSDPAYALDTKGPGNTLARFLSSSDDALVRIIANNYATEADARLFLGEADTYGMTFEYDGVSNIGYIGMNDNVDPTGSFSKRIQFPRTNNTTSFMAGPVSILKSAVSTVSLSVAAQATSTSSYGLEVTNATSNTRFLVDGVGNSWWYKADNALGMRWDAANARLGVGTSSPVATTDIRAFAGNTGLLVQGASGNDSVAFYTSGNTKAFYVQNDATVNQGDGDFIYHGGGNWDIKHSTSGQSMTFHTTNSSGTVEGMRLNSDRQLLIGTQTINPQAGNTNTGVQIGDGFIGIGRDNAEPLILNRHTADGNMILFRRDGTTKGYIQTQNGGDLVIGNDDTGILFSDGSNAVIPYNPSDGNFRDAVIDIGLSNHRFRHLSLYGGVYVGNGTASAPTMTFDSDTDTGFYRYSAGKISMTANGTEAMRMSGFGIDLSMNSSAYVDLNRSGFITFYGNGSNQHGIGSRDYAGTASDDIRINSFGSVNINLDANNDNSSAANFYIGKHGAGAGSMTIITEVNGENGNITTTGNVTAYGSPSDIRLKESIELIPDALAKVCSLRGVRFRYRKDGSRSTGLIAQELQEVLPEAVYEANEIASEQKFLAVRYGNTAGLLVEAIKEQQRTIDALMQRITKLEKTNGSNEDEQD